MPATSATVQLTGSRHPAPAMRRLDRVPGDEPITVSLYLTAVDDRPEPSGSRAALRAAREAAHVDDRARVAAFAAAHGLTVVEERLGRRLIRLAGPAAAMARAFGTEMARYEAADGAVYRGREGALHLPADLAPRVAAVLGLDTTPIATAKLVPHRGPSRPRGHLPSEVGALYGLPVDPRAGTGQCVGLIELGGGFRDEDTAAAFTAMGLAPPDVVAVAVNGTANAPGDGSGADGEVALDIQVAGALAPAARLAVYFAPNTSQGFVDAITQAIHDEGNAPAALSISWGSAEDGWSAQAVAAMHAAFADAARLGVSVFAASGDSLATDGRADGRAHVDYPAADPLVVGCGGTRISVVDHAITRETVWKSHGGGTGGGVGTLFARPGYQAGADVPAPDTEGGGRGVPDVAGNADPESGYRTVVDGQVAVVGGTSAVAPLWAGIVARLNAGRARAIGQPHDRLYAAAGTFRDITEGDNRSGRIGFAARPGWDACTGLGSPVGDALVRLFDEE